MCNNSKKKFKYLMLYQLLIRKVVFNVKSQSLKIFIFLTFYKNIKHFNWITEVHLIYKQFVSYWKYLNYFAPINFIE